MRRINSTTVLLAEFWHRGSSSPLPNRPSAAREIVISKLTPLSKDTGEFGVVYISFMYYLYGGAVTFWLVRSTPVERSGFEPWPGTLCCVLGEDTLLSQ